MNELIVAILIFHSGILVITGVKIDEESHKAVDRIRTVLMKNDLIY